MSRLVSVALAFALVVAAIPTAPVAAGALTTADANQPQTTTTRSTDGADAASLSPGQQLAGVLGVQAAELESEVETRRFDHAVHNASTNVSKAEAVAAQIERIRTRLDTLRNRLVELELARERGEITDREYRIRVARVVAELRALGRLAARTERVSGDLPLGLLAASGANVTAAYAVGVETDQAASGDAARIATAVAGRDVGRDVRDNRSRERARHALTTLDRLIDRASRLVDRADERVPTDHEDATVALAEARNHLATARSGRDDAARAYRADDHAAAIRHAERARRHLRRAVVQAHRAEARARIADRNADRAARAIEYAAEALETAQRAVAHAEAAGAGEDRLTAPLLERARTHVAVANDRLASARRANDVGNYTAARRYAKRSIARSEVARREARAAVNRSNRDDELTPRANEAIDRATERVEAATERVATAEATVGADDRAARASLESARDRLETARASLEAARSALAEDDATTALRHAKEARIRAEAAIAAADAAVRFAEATDEHPTEIDDPRTESSDQPTATPDG